MILKMLVYRKSETENAAYEEWNYFDNIVSASNYFDENVKSTVVRCMFQNGDSITIDIPNVAYLMSDAGKTIEKIVSAKVEELGDTEPVYNTLQDALSEAMKD